MKRVSCCFLILLLIFGLCACTERRVAEPLSTAAPAAEATSAPAAAPTAESTPETTPEPEAVELALRVEKNGGDVLPHVADGRIITATDLFVGDTLTVASADGSDIAALYLLWDAYPGEVQIETPGGRVQTVAGGRLHSLIRLEEPSPSLTLRRVNGEKNQPLCELSAYTAGSLPAEVQDWRNLADGEADILLFPAHADDEFVFFGGILPYYAGELGYKLQVCWMTYHEEDFVRNHELLNALWKSGCVYYPVINFASEDVKINSVQTAMVYYPFESWVEFQVEQLRRYQPLVVVGHDEQGEYGHGAHILASLTLEQAVVDAADGEKFPASAEKYGLWDTPKTYIHLFGDEPTCLDAALPLSAFGGKTMRDVAIDCYLEHDSQVHSSRYTVYDSSSPYDAFRFGLFRSLVGRDSERDDLFEHLDLSRPKSQTVEAAEENISGTPVSDAAGLLAIAADPRGSYTLTADIDMSGVEWMPFAFCGELDGRGHSIRNLSVRRCGAEKSVTVDGNLKEYDTLGAGLFSYTEGAYIHDLNLTALRIRIETAENCFAASFAGCFADTRFENCAAEGCVELISSGIMVGVGGIAGFGRGEFRHCRSSMTLIHRDRSYAARCEQFTGGIFACGHSELTNCTVDIRGYTSCHGYVHDGGLVGMEYQYYDRENHVIRYYTGNTISGFIEFFEHNEDRRAYCDGFVGENLLWSVNYASGNASTFERRETNDYSTELLPENYDSLWEGFE